MNRGFYIILFAQFFSSLADNSLLFAAIELLKQRAAPSWETPILQQSFVLSFIFLAPFAGAIADSIPKGKAMLISNSIKMVGCIALFFGIHPLLAYGLVGTGAALYSPAKYGILTEYLPADRLVWANGWMEGLTVAAIILGAIVGGLLIGSHVEIFLGQVQGWLMWDRSNITAPELSIIVVFVFYLSAAMFNLFIPKLPIEHALPNKNIRILWDDFWRCFLLLWRDPLGQVSLAVTSLFWGAGTTLRFIILIWAASALHFDLQQATQLTAVVAVGLAIGSVIAAKLVPLHHAVNVLPLGIAMGLAIVLMAWISDWRLAIIMLIIIGTLAGIFLIPMNALLQYRGHLLMGSGHSIALQNFNENTSILLMLGAYAIMIDAEISVKNIIIIFGLFISMTMAWLNHKHSHDQDLA